MSGKTIVLLIPSRTDTQWFHEIILKNNYEIRFLKGRLKFIDIYLIRESKKILHGIEKSIAKKGLEVETAKKDFFEAVETFRKEFPIADQDIDEPSEYELMVNKNTQSERVKYKELKRMLTAKGKEHHILKDKVG